MSSTAGDISVSSDGSDSLLGVKVVPGARRDGIVGVHDGRLKVAVSAPPENGRANARLLEVLVAALEIRIGQVCIQAGADSPRKTVRIKNVLPDALRSTLRRLLRQDEAGEPVVAKRRGGQSSQ